MDLHIVIGDAHNHRGLRLTDNFAFVGKNTVFVKRSRAFAFGRFNEDLRIFAENIELLQQQFFCIGF